MTIEIFILSSLLLSGIYYCNRGDLVWLSEDGQSSWCTRVITTFPTSPLTQPSPAATGATPVASSVTSAAIAAVAAARAAGLANLTSNSAVAQHHAHNAAVAHAAVAAQQQQQQTQPQVTTHATSVVSTGNNPSAVVTGTPQVAATVNGRKRRMSSSNSGNNNSSPSYPRMENSSNLSQSMDSVNTASGEEEVSIEGASWEAAADAVILNSRGSTSAHTHTSNPLIPHSSSMGAMKCQKWCREKGGNL